MVVVRVSVGWTVSVRGPSLHWHRREGTRGSLCSGRLAHRLQAVGGGEGKQRSGDIEGCVCERERSTWHKSQRHSRLLRHTLGCKESWGGVPRLHVVCSLQQFVPRTLRIHSSNSTRRVSKNAGECELKRRLGGQAGASGIPRFNLSPSARKAVNRLYTTQEKLSNLTFTINTWQTKPRTREGAVTWGGGRQVVKRGRREHWGGLGRDTNTRPKDGN